MKSYYRRLICLLPLLMFAIGCGSSPEARLIGSWDGQFILNESAPQPQDENPFANALGNTMKAGMQDMIANLKPTYTFKADKTFTFSMASPLGNAQASGNWEVIAHSGDTLTVRLNPSNGNNFERAITFTDADHFQTQDDNGTLQFTRQPSS